MNCIRESYLKLYLTLLFLEFQNRKKEKKKKEHSFQGEILIGGINGSTDLRQIKLQELEDIVLGGWGCN